MNLQYSILSLCLVLFLSFTFITVFCRLHQKLPLKCCPKYGQKKNTVKCVSWVKDSFSSSSQQHSTQATVARKKKDAYAGFKKNNVQRLSHLRFYMSGYIK